MKEIAASIIIFLIMVLILSGCGGSGEDTTVFDIGQRFQYGRTDLENPSETPSANASEPFDISPADSSGNGDNTGSEISEPSPPNAPIEIYDFSNMDDIIEIGDRFFILQMNEIFLNYRRYLGRVVQYEGVFKTIDWWCDYVNHYIVIRYTFGCCGMDGMIGFEILLEGFEPFPDDTWVEIIGVLDMDDGFLVLRVISLTEMDERGLDFVF